MNVLNRPLKLKKTYDKCVSGKPRLTVVMIHGIASDSSSFDAALKYLTGTTSLKDVRFVTFDLLGAGQSYASDKLKYNYSEQVTALENAIADLKTTTPLVLIGHSMGTMIVTRYMDRHKRGIKKLVLISAPIYRPEDIKSPAFKLALDGFRQVVGQKNAAMLSSKAFNNELKYIVSDVKNYSKLVGLTKPTILIYGDADQIIAPFNIPAVLKANPKITAIRTIGGHGVSREKYSKLVGILEEVLNA